jgi:hypothetical protein
MVKVLQIILQARVVVTAHGCGVSSGVVRDLLPFVVSIVVRRRRVRFPNDGGIEAPLDIGVYTVFADVGSFANLALLECELFAVPMCGGK